MSEHVGALIIAILLAVGLIFVGEPAMISTTPDGIPPTSRRTTAGVVDVSPGSPTLTGVSEPGGT